MQGLEVISCSFALKGAVTFARTGRLTNELKARRISDADLKGEQFHV